jgi:hypothetical protein
MWIDSGIDSGALIATERTPLSGKESLLQLNIAVMEHAHALYVRCIRRFIERSELPSVPQATLPSNRLFLSKDWGLRQMVMAWFNFCFYFRPESPFLSYPPDAQFISIE